METICKQLFLTRMNRINFITASLIQFFIGIIIMVAVLAVIFQVGASMVSSLFFLALVFVVLFYQASIHVRRIHDINKSPWWLLIVLIPYVGIVVSIYLAIAEGVPVRNRYGEQDTSGVDLKAMFVGKALPNPVPAVAQDIAHDTRAE